MTKHNDLESFAREANTPERYLRCVFSTNRYLQTAEELLGLMLKVAAGVVLQWDIKLVHSVVGV